jgi:hypothetical protein
LDLDDLHPRRPANSLVTLSSSSTAKSVAYGIVGTALIHAVLLTARLLAAGIPAAGALGFLALLIALSQTGILLVVIWGGAAWWLFNNSTDGWAIFIMSGASSLVLIM